jgi:transporter family protein
MAFKETIKTHWFWYSILAVLCWGGWAMMSKLGSREIPPETMQFLFTVGTLPIAVILFVARKFRLEKSSKGISYGILNGILSGIGGLTLFAAYHTGSNTTLVTSVSALYPMVTVLLAVTLLRENIRPVQIVGLLFAAVAIVIFSL